MVSNTVFNIYTDLHQMIQEGQTAIEDKVNELSKALQQTPPEHTEWLQKIKALKVISLTKQVEGIQSFLLKKKLSGECDLRKLIDAYALTNNEIKGELIAYWINTHHETENWPSLKIEDFSKEELLFAAPHLTHVHEKCLVNLDNEEIEKFLNKCHNATQFFLNSNKNVTNLKVNYCKFLTVATLSNMPQLEVINLSYSPLKVLEVINAPLIREVFVANCLNLTSVKGSFPKCCNFNYRGSPKLVEMEELPSTSRVYSNEQIDAKKLGANPVEVLLEIGESRAIRHGAIPLVVYSNGHEKRGGLEHRLIPTLFKHLFKKRNSFPTVELFGGKIPVLKQGDEKSELALETFGKLIGFCACSSTRMGAFLPHQFFKGLFVLTDEELNDNSQKKFYSAMNDIEDEEEFGEKEALAIKTTPFSEVFLSSAIIAKGLKQFMGDELSCWRKEPHAFAEEVQGLPVTREALRHYLAYESGDDYYVEDKHIAEMKGYFEQFIDYHPDKLIDLVEYFTGNRTIGRNYKIDIKVQKKDSDFEVDWAWSDVEIPYFSDYNEFDKNLLKRLN